MGIEVLAVSNKLPKTALKSVNLEINIQQPDPSA